MIKRTYQRIKPFLPAGLFLAGFLWDSLTLKRIDNLLDLFILLGYLLLASAAFIAIARKLTFKFSQHLPLAQQFFLGGLLSAFVVYYFKSASSWPAVFFVIFIFGLLVANEIYGERQSRIIITTILLALCAFMFFNYAVPVLIRHMGVIVFILSLLVSFGFVRLVQKLAGNPEVTLKPVLVLYGAISLFYVLNVIPPVPLSKKALGIFRSVHREEDKYVCAMEKPWFLSLRKTEKEFKYAEGDTVFCFSSIFAPVALKTRIFHVWQYYDEREGEYVQTDRRGYAITGGRDQGYRGYSYKTKVRLGKWRVLLQAEGKKTLGAVKFEVVERDTSDVVVLKRLEW